MRKLNEQGAHKKIELKYISTVTPLTESFILKSFELLSIFPA